MIQLHRFLIAGIATLLLANPPCLAQEESAEAVADRTQESVRAIIVETLDPKPKLPVIFTGSAEAMVQIGKERVEQEIRLTAKVVQGEATTISFGLAGDGEVFEVSGEGLQSWSIRRADASRFLDIEVAKETNDLTLMVKIRSAILSLPAQRELTHLTPGDSIGFSSNITIRHDPEITTRVSQVDGFVPLGDQKRIIRLQSTSGGRIVISLNRSGGAPAAVEMTETTLVGQLHENGDSVSFQFHGVAKVNEPDTRITVLSGDAAISQIPDDAAFRLKLAPRDKGAVYELVFPDAGTFSIDLQFVARLHTPTANEARIDFTVAASAVVPITLNGFSADLEFHRDPQTIVPLRENNAWLGFLPASGRAHIQWKGARKSQEGKLFFATTGHTEAQMSAGLLRQDHRIDYQVLQGELDSIQLTLDGPGEVMDVVGENVVSWNVTENDAKRSLAIELSQPVTGTRQIRVRSQTPFGAFPARVAGLRLTPVGAIRHSGYLRLTNLGSVRLEPTELSGLTQLAPDQYPGEAIEARQIFAYRFPTAEYGYTIAADRIQPEVNISQLVLYQLGDTDRVIQADMELDIREAPIREWDFGIPSDYSVVAVTGASIADYIVASEAPDATRNLKVIFADDVVGRQLVSLHLEKSQAAAAEDWVLPQIAFPGAKSVRGDIGVVGAPGFRVSVGQTDLLVEKPLSYFPKPTANLQQAFRIRQSGWSATMTIELLERSVQSDVFHLYSLSQETVYGSALINYFVTGAPVSEWRITVPESLGNVMVDGQDVRTWRREGDTLIVSLHQSVIGAYTLLVTYEEKPGNGDGTFQAGPIVPLDVQGERGYIQVVSPMQVDVTTQSVSESMLQLDPLELPAEFRLLSTAPPLGTWQYTERPFNLSMKVDWFQPGTTAAQVVEFSEANSRVSKDGELVTDVIYYVKSRGRRTLEVKLPGEPVRLWDVAVNGVSVTARQTDEATLIPLPGSDPNIPIEVSLRLGKPAVAQSNPRLALPIVFAPVLKTQWNVTGDEGHVLVPVGGSVATPEPVLRPSGFDWVAKKGLPYLVIFALFTVVGAVACRRTGFLCLGGLGCLAFAAVVAVMGADEAWSDIGRPAPLQLSLPILSAGEAVQLQVENMALWRVDISWPGIAAIVVGVMLLALSFLRGGASVNALARCVSVILISLGILLHGNGAPWFFGVIGLGVFVLLFVPPAVAMKRGIWRWGRAVFTKRRANKPATDPTPGADPGSGPEAGAVTATALLFALLTFASASSGFAALPKGFEATDAITQSWNIDHDKTRLTASGEVKLSGLPGERFLLLRAPAVLTRFDGKGLRLVKEQIEGVGLAYVVSIPVSDEQNDSQDAKEADYVAEFEYQVEAIAMNEGVAVLTGAAAFQEVELRFDVVGWEVRCPTAVRVETLASDVETHAKVLLGLGDSKILLNPKVRDVTAEETAFFVEASNLYIPGPGVVDGHHQLHVRTSQGQVSELNVSVPQGFTVSSVGGPVGSWQFDAEKGLLKIGIEPAQSAAFTINIETQRGLESLPAEVVVSPLTVADAGGQVGLVAAAFGPDAQPEKVDPQQMSAVNLSDFDAKLLENKQAVLHRVYRYGQDGGQLTIRVVPVESEVRVVSKQVLSLGDERVVLGVNFAAEIARAGLFQLSFLLPDGLEVESLSGAALHHWSELSEGGSRQIILHLNGKTIGTQTFSLTLTGNAPNAVGDWEVPRFELTEATRQTGELIVRPTTGIRLRTVSRQNVSETDPRAVGGKGQGALAFRLLQRDWNLVLGIEKLDPWVTGQVLHEIVLREGQTRSALFANFEIQNASIRTLSVVLPIFDDDVIKTLRASGDVVSDFVRTDPDSNVWEIRFKRRVVGNVQFRIEFESRGERDNDGETLTPFGFPQTRQLSYFFGVRAGGRLEVGHESLTQGWQRADWNAVPQRLRDAGNRSAPVLVLRAVAPPGSLGISVKRHSLADALKLRVREGTLTTVLSATGDQLTAVDVTMEVIQRSSLTVGLPAGGDLFSIFVNGESVNSIRLGENSDTWQFYILPGIDDRTASVRFVYSLTGDRLKGLKLQSPQLNVPLEKIEWNVVAPPGFELTNDDGNLELYGAQSQQGYDRNRYLSKASGKRQSQAREAAQLLERANQLLQAGEQTKARWALNSVANQYALDAASNEDARVQLENLQTQQAIVGLNTRRQRLYLDNSDDGVMPQNDQLRQAAADNPILQDNQLNFRPQQLSQLLQGNSNEDNAVLQQIAGRLVQHQRTTEPAPQAILISMPEEGTAYTFRRTVQVAENAPLELELDFELHRRLRNWQIAVVLVLLGGFALAFTVGALRKSQTTGDAAGGNVAASEASGS